MFYMTSSVFIPIPYDCSSESKQCPKCMAGHYLADLKAAYYDYRVGFLASPLRRFLDCMQQRYLQTILNVKAKCMKNGYRSIFNRLCARALDSNGVGESSMLHEYEAHIEPLGHVALGSNNIYLNRRNQALNRDNNNLDQALRHRARKPGHLGKKARSIQGTQNDP
ncbi:hypothetical protein BDW22DRAFT_813380 [Trametopsis cervina]|nr:hypothetical protein BDW22DRAFT_813380 [Trametopsis cervina]